MLTLTLLTVISLLCLLCMLLSRYELSEVLRDIIFALSALSLLVGIPAVRLYLNL